MKMHENTFFSPVPVLFILVQWILVSLASPVVTDKTGADSSFLKPVSPSLLALYNSRKSSSDFTGELKDSEVLYKSDGEKVEVVKSPDTFYLESLDEEKLKSSSSSCAASCGHGQGTMDIPLCFSCVGLANAHIKPVAVSKKNQ